VLSGRVRVSPRAAWQVVGGEAIVLDVSTGRAVGLNEVGTFIWKRLGTSSLDSIVSEMIDEFDVDEATAREDLGRFVDDFVRQEILLVEP
jgi:hypothetical protein